MRLLTLSGFSVVIIAALLAAVASGAGPAGAGRKAPRGDETVGLGPTATPTPIYVGDWDCDGDVDTIDARNLFRTYAGLTVSQQAGCPAIGSLLSGGWVFGDVDCSSTVDPLDALLVMRFVIMLPYATNGCPFLGEFWTGQPVPTPAPTPTPAPGTAHVGISSTNVLPFGTVTVEVVASAPPPGLGAWGIDVVYDSSMLTLVDCVTRSEWPIILSACNPAFATDTLRLAGAVLPGPASGSAVTGSLTFKAGAAPGIANLDVQVELLSHPEGPLYSTNVTDGTITVAAAAGDTDCGGAVNAVDALFVLRHVAGLGDSACITAGNVKCDDGLTAVDSLFILRYVAALLVTLPAGCPEIGS